MLTKKQTHNAADRIALNDNSFNLAKNVRLAAVKLPSHTLKRVNRFTMLWIN